MKGFSTLIIFVFCSLFTMAQFNNMAVKRYIPRFGAGHQGMYSVSGTDIARKNTFDGHSRGFAFFVEIKFEGILDFDNNIEGETYRTMTVATPNDNYASLVRSKEEWEFNSFYSDDYKDEYRYQFKKNTFFSHLFVDGFSVNRYKPVFYHTTQHDSYVRKNPRYSTNLTNIHNPSPDPDKPGEWFPSEINLETLASASPNFSILRDDNYFANIDPSFISNLSEINKFKFIVSPEEDLLFAIGINESNRYCLVVFNLNRSDINSLANKQTLTLTGGNADVNGDFLNSTVAVVEITDVPNIPARQNPLPEDSPEYSVMPNDYQNVPLKTPSVPIQYLRVGIAYDPFEKIIYFSANSKLYKVYENLKREEYGTLLADEYVESVSYKQKKLAIATYARPIHKIYDTRNVKINSQNYDYYNDMTNNSIETYTKLLCPKIISEYAFSDDPANFHLKLPEEVKVKIVDNILKGHSGALDIECINNDFKQNNNDINTTLVNKLSLSNDQVERIKNNYNLLDEPYWTNSNICDQEDDIPTTSNFLAEFQYSWNNNLLLKNSIWLEGNQYAFSGSPTYKLHRFYERSNYYSWVDYTADLAISFGNSNNIEYLKDYSTKVGLYSSAITHSRSLDIAYAFYTNNSFNPTSYMDVDGNLHSVDKSQIPLPDMLPNIGEYNFMNNYNYGYYTVAHHEDGNYWYSKVDKQPETGADTLRLERSNDYYQLADIKDYFGIQIEKVINDDSELVLRLGSNDDILLSNHLINCSGRSNFSFTLSNTCYNDIRIKNINISNPSVSLNTPLSNSNNVIDRSGTGEQTYNFGINNQANRIVTVVIDYDILSYSNPTFQFPETVVKTKSVKYDIFIGASSDYSISSIYSTSSVNDNNGYCQKIVANSEIANYDNRYYALFVREKGDIGFLDFDDKYFINPQVINFPAESPSLIKQNNWFCTSLIKTEAQNTNLYAYNLDTETKYITYLVELYEYNTDSYRVLSKERIEFVTAQNNLLINEIDNYSNQTNFIELFNNSIRMDLNGVNLGFVRPNNISTQIVNTESVISLNDNDFLASDYFLIASEAIGNTNIVDANLNNYFSSDEKLVILYKSNPDINTIGKDQILDAIIYNHTSGNTYQDNYLKLGISTLNQFPDDVVDDDKSVQRKNDGKGGQFNSSAYRILKPSPGHPNGIFPYLTSGSQQVEKDADNQIEASRFTYVSYDPSYILPSIKIYPSSSGQLFLKDGSTTTNIDNIDGVDVDYSDLTSGFLYYNTTDDKNDQFKMEVNQGFYTSIAYFSLPLKGSAIPFIDFSTSDNTEIFEDDPNHIINISIVSSIPSKKPIAINLKYLKPAGVAKYNEDFQLNGDVLSVDDSDPNFTIISVQLSQFEQSKSLEFNILNDNLAEVNESLNLYIDTVEDSDGNIIDFSRNIIQIQILNEDFAPVIKENEIIKISQFYDPSNLVRTLEAIDEDLSPGTIIFSTVSDPDDFYNIINKNELYLNSSNFANFVSQKSRVLEIKAKDTDENYSEPSSLEFEILDPLKILPDNKTNIISSSLLNDQEIFQFIAVDPNNGDVRDLGGQWQISGSNSDKFKIDSNSGLISLSSSANISSNETYEIQVKYIGLMNETRQERYTFNSDQTSEVPKIKDNQIIILGTNYVPPFPLTEIQLDNRDDNYTYKWRLADYNQELVKESFVLSEDGQLRVIRAITDDYKDDSVIVYVETLATDGTNTFLSAIEPIEIKIEKQYEVISDSYDISKNISTGTSFGVLETKPAHSDVKYHKIISSSDESKYFGVNEDGEISVIDNTTIIANPNSSFTYNFNVYAEKGFNVSEFKTISINISDLIPNIDKNQQFKISEGITDVVFGSIEGYLITNTTSFNVESYIIDNVEYTDAKFDFVGNGIKLINDINLSGSSKDIFIELVASNGAIKSNAEKIKLTIVPYLSVNNNQVTIPIGIDETDVFFKLEALFDDGSILENATWELNSTSGNTDLFNISADGYISLVSGASSNLASNTAYELKLSGSSDLFTTGDLIFTINTDDGSLVPNINQIPDGAIKIGEKLIFNSQGHYNSGFYNLTAINATNEIEWKLISLKNKSLNTISTDDVKFELSKSGELMLNEPIDFDSANDEFIIRVNVSANNGGVVYNSPYKDIKVKILKQPEIIFGNTEFSIASFTNKQQTDIFLLTTLDSEYDNPVKSLPDAKWHIIEESGENNFKLDQSTGRLYLLCENIKIESPTTFNLDFYVENPLHKSKLVSQSIGIKELDQLFINRNQTFFAKENKISEQVVGIIKGYKLSDVKFNIEEYLLPKDIDDNLKNFSIDNTTNELKLSSVGSSSDISEFVIYVSASTSDNSYTCPAVQIKIEVRPVPLVDNHSFQISDHVEFGDIIGKLTASFPNGDKFDGTWTSGSSSIFHVDGNGYIKINTSGSLEDRVHLINVVCTSTINSNIKTLETEISIEKKENSVVPHIEKITSNPYVCESFVPTVPLVSLDIKDMNNSTTYKWDLEDVNQDGISNKFRVSSNGELFVNEGLKISDVGNQVNLYINVEDLSTNLKSALRHIVVDIIEQPTINEKEIYISKYIESNKLINEFTYSFSGSQSPNWSWLDYTNLANFNLLNDGKLFLVDNSDINSNSSLSFTKEIDIQLVSEFIVSKLETIQIHFDSDIPQINSNQLFNLGEGVKNVNLGGIKGYFKEGNDLSGLEWDLISVNKYENDLINQNLFEISDNGEIMVLDQAITYEDDLYYTIKVRAKDKSNLSSVYSLEETIKVQIHPFPEISPEIVQINRTAENNDKVDNPFLISSTSIPNLNSITWTYYEDVNKENQYFDINSNGEIFLIDKEILKDFTKTSFDFSFYAVSDYYKTDLKTITIKVFENQHIPIIVENQVFELGDDVLPTIPLGIVQTKNKIATSVFGVKSILDNNNMDVSDKIELDNLTGEINVKSKVQASSIQNIKIEVYLRNNLDGKVYVSDPEVITINILEKPEITETSFFIPALADNGFRFGALEATYNNPKIKFDGIWEIHNHTDLFDIDSNTGELILLRSENTESTYNVEFSVQNDFHISNIKTIEITTGSTIVPFINKEQVFYTFENNYIAELGEIMGLNLENVTWEIVQCNVNGTGICDNALFSINNDNKLILSKSILSPEYVDVTLSIIAKDKDTPNIKSLQTDVKIVVKDIPIVLDQNFFVPRGFNTKSVFGQLEYTDTDSKIEDITWEVEYPDSAVKVESNSGRLIFEESSIWPFVTFRVRAVDSDGNMSDYANIRITLSVIQMPVIESNYFYLTEGFYKNKFEIGEVKGKFNNLPAKLVNWKLYPIVFSDDLKGFSIDYDTGILSVKGDVDYEAGNRLEFYVVAEEPSSNTKSILSKIYVDLLNIEDERPIINSDEIHMPELSASLSMSKSIAPLDANDPDGSGIIMYAISRDDPNYGIMYFDSEGYLFSGSNKLDSEVLPEFDLKVYVVDGVRKISKIKTIRVIVDNENDNPTLIDPNQTVSISELISNDDLVGDISLSDADGKLNYDYITIDTQVGSDEFYVKDNSIYLRDNRYINSSAVNSYDIELSVFSNGEKQTPVVYTVNVNSVSSTTKPTIESGQIFNLKQTEDIDFLIGEIKVSSEIGFVGWEIVNTPENQYFKIDRAGKLFVKDNSSFNSIEEPLLKLNVRVDCGASNISDVEEVLVNIIYDDVPTMSIEVVPANIQISENTPTGTVIGNINVIEGAPTSFAFESLNDKLSVDDKNQIILDEQLDAEFKYTYVDRVYGKHAGIYGNPASFTIKVDNVDEGTVELPYLGKVPVSKDDKIYIPVKTTDISDANYELEIVSGYESSLFSLILDNGYNYIVVNDDITTDLLLKYNVKGQTLIQQELTLINKSTVTDITLKGKTISLSKGYNSYSAFTKIEYSSSQDLNFVITEFDDQQYFLINDEGEVSLSSKVFHDSYLENLNLGDQINLKIRAIGKDNQYTSNEASLIINIIDGVNPPPYLEKEVIFVGKNIEQRDLIYEVDLINKDEFGQDELSDIDLISMDDKLEIKDKKYIYFSDDITKFQQSGDVISYVKVNVDDGAGSHQLYLKIVCSNIVPIIDKLQVFNINESNTESNTTSKVKAYSANTSFDETFFIWSSSNPEIKVNNGFIAFNKPPDYDKYELYQSEMQSIVTVTEKAYYDGKLYDFTSKAERVVVNVLPLDDEKPIVEVTNFELEENSPIGTIVNADITFTDLDTEPTKLNAQIVEYITKLPNSLEGPDLGSQIFDIRTGGVGRSQVYVKDGFLLDKELIGSDYNMILKIVVSDGTNLSDEYDINVDIIDIDEFPLDFEFANGKTTYSWSENFGAKKESEKIIINLLDYDLSSHDFVKMNIMDGDFTNYDFLELVKRPNDYEIKVRESFLPDFTIDNYGDNFKFMIKITSEKQLFVEPRWLKVDLMREKNIPVAVITNLEGSFDINSNESILLDAKDSYDPDGLALTYKWKILDKNDFSNVSDLSGNYLYAVAPSVSKTASRRISLVVVNEKGDISEEQIIEFNIIPNEYTDSYDPTSIPNPKTGSVINYDFNHEIEGDAFISISNLSGVVVYSSTVSASSGIIEFDLKEGIYLMTFISSSNNYIPVTRKIYKVNN
ncbi:MAG: T9SS type A sorting domain-containing protein [Marinifilaceae bacterium]|jgi:hypothetical protein|nr:T9SS type A sorting domain-containing protein [Marinifilaceae bacterium]